MASRVDELRKRLDKDPGSRLFAQLAEELRKLGDLDGAIDVCRSGLQKHPAYPSAHMTLGRALYDKGELAEARSELEIVLKGAADNILASRMLGECLEGLGAVPEAIERYKKTLVLAPGEPHVVERLANLEAGGEPSQPMSVVAPPESPADEIPEPERAPREPALSEPASPPIATVASQAAVRGVTRRGMTGKFQAKNVVAAALAAKKARQETGGGEAPPQAPEKKAHDVPTIANQPASASTASVSPESAEHAAAPGAQPGSGKARFPGMTDAESSLVGIQVGDLSAAHDVGGELPPTLPAGTQAPDFGETAGAPAPPAPAERAAAPPEELVSATLAELHVEQGHPEEAKRIYRKLLEREPENQKAVERLAELDGAAPASPGDRRAVVERQIAALERMLEGVRRG